MEKINSLRDAVTRHNRWSRANPDKMTVFVDSGHICFYTVILFVMDFTGDINDFTIPVMRWLWFNQRDLLMNPEKIKRLNSQPPLMTTTAPTFFLSSPSLSA